MVSLGEKNAVDALFWYLGAAVSTVFVAVIVWLCARLVYDAIECWRFVSRVDAVLRAEETPLGLRVLTKNWLLYWLGIQGRPVYMVTIKGGTVIYWPGKEGEPVRYAG